MDTSQGNEHKTASLSFFLFRFVVCTFSTKPLKRNKNPFAMKEMLIIDTLRVNALMLCSAEADV